jgi:hypothetical protein
VGGDAQWDDYASGLPTSALCFISFLLYRKKNKKKKGRVTTYKKKQQRQTKVPRMREETHKKFPFTASVFDFPVFKLYCVQSNLMKVGGE